MTQFFFAWVDADTTFDPAVHNRNDEAIIGFTVEHIEGEFASLAIDMKNPKIGLLSTGRKVWAYLSWDNGAGVVPIFYGRLVGIPSNMHLEGVTLQFVARPSDYAAQKDVLANGMRVLPYYDPVFIAVDAQADPDVVLEGRTEVWAIDRVTHELSTSDLLVGEDGLVEFTADDVPYDSVEVTLDQPPVRKVRVTAEASWSQDVDGGLPFLRNYMVESLTAKGLVGSWPKAETTQGNRLGNIPAVPGGGGGAISGSAADDELGPSLGGGWYVRSSSARLLSENLSDDDLRAGALPLNHKMIVSSSATQSQQQSSFTNTWFAIAKDKAFLSMSVRYKASRQRKDTVTFELVADAQPIITMPGDDEVLDLKVTANDVGEVLTPDDYDVPPIGDKSRRAYFTQPRGLQSVQYLVQLARAHIIVRSRAVKIKFKCKFEKGMAFSLRKNASIQDPRLPSGQALGKIVGYTLKVEDGSLYSECVIACSIGYGGAAEAAAGVPSYVNDGYVQTGYQFMDGERVILGAGDVSFLIPSTEPNDDGLVFPLTRMPLISPVQSSIVETVPLVEAVPQITESIQKDDCGDTTSASMSFTLDTSPITAWLGGMQTRVQWQMRAIEGGPFETLYEIDVSPLKLPQQINLEAA